jgi:tetratricopeptide (TPR) repeat protein
VSGFIVAGVSLHPAFGQGRGGVGTTGTTGTSGGATAPSVPTTRPTAPSGTTQPTAPPQPIFLSGQVMIDDGTAPTEPVVIERVCRGQSHAEGYTDSRGYFSIQLFHPNSGVLQDASEDSSYRSVMGGMGVGGSQSGAGTAGNTAMSNQERMLFDCELRAKAPGFRSQSIMLANRRALDPPDVGVILLHRTNASEEGSTVSAVSLAAPKDAHKAYVKGLELLKKDRTGDALANFEKAVEVYPDYAAAWYEIGRIELAANDNAAARHALEMAVKADPRFVLPYLDLSTVELRAQKWQALADVTDKVIKLDSFDYPQAYYYNAAANYYLKNLDKAEKNAREADRLDSRREIPKNLHLLGIILAQRQDYAGAAEKFRAYLKLAPDADDAPTVRKQLAQVETAVAQAKTKDQEPH